MKNRRFTDEELVAFLDGESEFAPMDAIATALETDDDLQKRIEALSLSMNSIERGFASLSNSAPQMPELTGVVAPTSAPKRGFGLTSMLAAASLALVVGFGASQVVATKSAPGWMEYVAAYQALYANSTLAHLNISTEAKRTELARVSDAIGKELDLNILESGDSVDYKRAQILGFEGRPLIQMAFLSKVGDPVALCIIRSSDASEAALDTARMEGMSSASWSKDGYSYLLIGGTDDGLIEDLAVQFASQI